MRSLYLRIYLTVVVALALFALVSGWLVQRHLNEQRVLAESAMRERFDAWADLLQRSLPSAQAPREEQAAALRDWSLRLRLPMALLDASGQRIAASEGFARRETEGRPGFAERVRTIRLDDGRQLLIPRVAGMRPPGSGPPERRVGAPQIRPPWQLPPSWPDGVGLAALLVVLFLAVAGGAWPVVRRLTRRLEALKLGVETFGAGALHHRVTEEGKDEVAAVATSFNRAAARVEALVRSHQSLLANASHELRSPLGRLKLALTMLDETDVAGRPVLKREIDANIAELDALVDEVLLSSRLESTQLDVRDTVELLGLAAEEAARFQAVVVGESVCVEGDERLLRRALRNLLENARRYGGGEIELSVEQRGARAELRVCDRGPGVPPAQRERIFEPFFRLPGHAERAGGVGLGLALVRQIAVRHGGQAACEPREGGGSCFVLSLPLS